MCNGGFKGTYIIPDGHIVLIPAEPDLKIMVVRDEPNKLLQEMIALPLCQIIDSRHMRPHRIDALPSRDRIRAHDRMHREEFLADIQG